jgi:hypothetical protein
VTFDKGRVLAANEQFADAIKSFDEALELPSRDGKPADADILLHRAMAAQRLGNGGFKEDLRKAAAEGSKRAAALLEEVG